MGCLTGGTRGVLIVGVTDRGDVDWGCEVRERKVEGRVRCDIIDKDVHLIS